MTEAALTEKELQILTTVLMTNKEVKGMWQILRRRKNVPPYTVLRGFLGGLIKVEPKEIRDILFKLSSLAGEEERVRAMTRHIFADLKIPESSE